MALHEHGSIIMSYRWSPRSGLFKTMILQQHTITKWSNQKYVMYSYQGQCLLHMQSDGIWNDLELQRTF